LFFWILFSIRNEERKKLEAIKQLLRSTTVRISAQRAIHSFHEQALVF
jgi:hypothetical protein